MKRYNIEIKKWHWAEYSFLKQVEASSAKAAIALLAHMQDAGKLRAHEVDKHEDCACCYEAHCKVLESTPKLEILPVSNCTDCEGCGYKVSPQGQEWPVCQCVKNQIPAGYKGLVKVGSGRYFTA